MYNLFLYVIIALFLKRAVNRDSTTFFCGIHIFGLVLPKTQEFGCHLRLTLNLVNLSKAGAVGSFFAAVGFLRRSKYVYGQVIS